MSLRDFDDFAARLRQLIRCTIPFGNCAEPMGMGSNIFQELALELFDLQFQQNEAYRRFCKTRGVPSGALNHWDQIPAIPAAGFKELDLSVIPFERRTRVFHSSGTTTHRPSRHFHCAESLALYEDSLWPWFLEHLLPEWVAAAEVNDPGSNSPRSPGSSKKNSSRPTALVVLAPRAANAPNSSLVRMFETIAERYPWERSAFFGMVNENNEWSIDWEAALRFFEIAEENELPVLVLGTAFSFVHFLDHVSARGRLLRLPLGSRALETGVYKGRSRVLTKAELHHLIERTLGIPRPHIICEYGMSELSSQAYDRQIGACAESGRCFSFPPWAQVQIISPETGLEVEEGESGLIRVFDLANVYSVMAVQTEDLGIKRGNTFEWLGRSQHAESRGCSLLSA
jgi:hypothetical protein